MWRYTNFRYEKQSVKDDVVVVFVVVLAILGNSNAIYRFEINLPP